MTSSAYDTVLVTGAAGFVGAHLLAHLAQVAAPPHRVVAVDVRPGRAAGARWRECDLAQMDPTRALLQAVQPEAVVHLASVTQGDDVGAYFAANVQAAATLLEAASSLPTPPRVLMVGSAAQYGITSGEHEVVDEARPTAGTTPYAVSKNLQEQWALLYHRLGRVPVVCVRPFNLMGPGQPPTLVPAAFLEQVADVVDGKAESVRVGNTATRRDFLDVRDAVAAMWAVLRAGEEALGQVFNIASGRAVLVQDMLEACMALAGREIPVQRNPARFRPVDVQTIIGDPSKLRECTGWRPRIPWRQSLDAMWHTLREGAPAS